MGFATSVSRIGSIVAVFSFPIIDALYGLKATGNGLSGIFN